MTEEKEEVKEEKVEEKKEEAKEEKIELKEEKQEAQKEEKEKKVVSAKNKELVEKLDSMTILEISELVSELESHWGVSAAAPIAAGAAIPSGGAVSGEVAEEKTMFDLILANSGDKKIQVIKVVREIKPDLGLKEAKDLVEAAPKQLLKGAKKEEAESAKKKLEEAGATVELK